MKVENRITKLSKWYKTVINTDISFYWIMVVQMYYHIPPEWQHFTECMCRNQNIAKYDYHESVPTEQKHTQTERQTLDKVMPMCRYASQATQQCPLSGLSQPFSYRTVVKSVSIQYLSSQCVHPMFNMLHYNRVLVGTIIQPAHIHNLTKIQCSRHLLWWSLHVQQIKKTNT